MDCIIKTVSARLAAWFSFTGLFTGLARIVGQNAATAAMPRPSSAP
jgi:hypothetical protein